MENSITSVVQYFSKNKNVPQEILNEANRLMAQGYITKGTKVGEGIYSTELYWNKSALSQETQETLKDSFLKLDSVDTVEFIKEVNIDPQ